MLKSLAFNNITESGQVHPSYIYKYSIPLPQLMYVKETVHMCCLIPGVMNYKITRFTIFNAVCRIFGYQTPEFVSYLRQVGGFLRTLRFPPPIKLTAEI